MTMTLADIDPGFLADMRRVSGGGMINVRRSHKEKVRHSNPRQGWALRQPEKVCAPNPPRSHRSAGRKRMDEMNKHGGVVSFTSAMIEAYERGEV